VCANAVETMTVTMQALLPVLGASADHHGRLCASGGILNPFIVTAITVFNSILQRFIMPAVYPVLHLHPCEQPFGEGLREKACLLIRNAAVSVIGLAVTLFSGLTIVQGLVTRTADGMLAKTAKYSVDNFVPSLEASRGFAGSDLKLYRYH
jgi:stage III sporulation protein AE